MTAVAFILGVVPLVVASGAGAGARQSIGTTVFGGMILATLLDIVFVPVMFVAFEMLAQTVPRLVRARRENAARAGE
jgi:multidrug efflux pump subunit AcrB